MNNNKYLYWVVGVLVVLAIAYGVYSSRKNSPAPQGNTQNTASTTPVASTTPAAAKSAPAKNPTLSYGDAIKAYPNRFQFIQCQATPASIVVKKGGVVMLDNRDSVAHTIKTDNQSFAISGLHYALLHTSTIGKLNVSCDGANRATLNVEP